MTATLFPCADSLLPWLPEETLFSLCSRHHRLWGHSLSGRSAQILFGRPRIGTQHDFPSGLDEFVSRTGEQLGSVAEIARERTLLRFYRPFLSPRAIEDSVVAMRGPAVSGLKFRLGLLTSRFRANHPLKACRACMQVDLRNEGWVYWHLVHQYPGVWMCPRHRSSLDVSTVKSTGVGRFLWALPAKQQLVGGGVPEDATNQAAQRHLTELSVALVTRNAPDGWLSVDEVRRTLQSRLQERGWLTPGGNIRLSHAARDYLHHCTTLRGPEELNSLPTSLDDSMAQLGRILRPARAGIHPVRLLTVISWLYPDANTFLAEFESCEAPTHGDQSNEETGSEPGSHDDLKRKHAVEQLKAGASATSTAKMLGVDVITVMAWVASAGVQAVRRPRTLTLPVRRQIVKSLRRGTDKSEVANQHGISVATITKLLRTEVGLRAEWNTARFSAAQNRARTAWEQLCADHIGCGVKLLRAMDPASYAWLYRNDRAWLVTRTPPRAATANINRRSSVRWDNRDLHLSARVQQVAERLTRGRGGKPLLLWQIYQQIPELKPKLRALHRLPLTKRALDDVVGVRLHRNGGELFPPVQPEES